MSYYDWEKIFKNKTDKELYHIFIGETILNDEVKLPAEIELKNRKFDFDNIERHSMKWELEELKQEDSRKNSFISRRKMKAQDLLQIFYIGLIFTLFAILNLFFNFLNSSNETQSFHEKILILLAIIGINVFIYIEYRLIKKSKVRRNTRIQELIKLLKLKNRDTKSFPNKLL
jgi:amino acid permease